MKLQLTLLDDLFYRGTGPTGDTGPTGATGPTGDSGPSFNTYAMVHDESNAVVPKTFPITFDTTNLSSGMFTTQELETFTYQMKVLI